MCRPVCAFVIHIQLSHNDLTQENFTYKTTSAFCDIKIDFVISQISDDVLKSQKFVTSQNAYIFPRNDISQPPPPPPHRTSADRQRSKNKILSNIEQSVFKDVFYLLWTVGSIVPHNRLLFHGWASKPDAGPEFDCY